MAHRLLARRQRPCASGQEPQPFFESFQEGRRRQDLDEGGGQFDRQRQPIEARADFGHCGSVVIGDSEVGFHGPCPLNEKTHGLVLVQCLQWWEMGRIR